MGRLGSFTLGKWTTTHPPLQTLLFQHNISLNLLAPSYETMACRLFFYIYIWKCFSFRHHCSFLSLLFVTKELSGDKLQNLCQYQEMIFFGCSVYTIFTVILTYQGEDLSIVCKSSIKLRG